MMWNVIKWTGVSLTSLLFFTITGLEALAANDSHLFFVALAGTPVYGKAPVLLRWYITDGLQPVGKFAIYRKAGDPASDSPMTLLAVTSRLRNVPLIRSVFEQPETTRAYEDILNSLTYMLDEPVNPETYAEQLLGILDGGDSCGTCAMRRNLLVQTNFGVAIVEGLGYLDLAAPGIYTYELRTDTGFGPDTLVLGRATIDASKPTRLPPPLKPEVVDIPGERGHLKVFLRWDNSAALDQQKKIMFGYNVFRGDSDLTAENFDSLLAQGRLQKINRLPIVPLTAQAKGAAPDEDYMFVDDNRSLEKTGPVGELFTGGDQYTYWVAARDLLGQNGTPSPPISATVQDKHAPETPRDLRTEVVEVNGMQRVWLTWARNTDDTAQYFIYRFQEYEHIGKADPFPPVNGMPEGYIAQVLQTDGVDPVFTDPAVKLPEQENQAFWYCVAALDAAGNMSALSPPIRGVIFDTTPPAPPSLPEICTFAFHCSLKNFQLSDTSTGDGAHRNVYFYVTRESPEIQKVRIERLHSYAQLPGLPSIDSDIFVTSAQVSFEDPTPTPAYEIQATPTPTPPDFSIPEATATPTPAATRTPVPNPTETPAPNSNQLSRYISVAEVEFPEDQDYVDVEDLIELTPGDASLISYRVTFILEDDQPCGFYEMPDEYFSLVNQTRYNLFFVITIAGEVGEYCYPGGDREHWPVDEEGVNHPLRFNFPRSDDAAGIILYRSPDCENFVMVAQKHFEGNASLTILDDYRPAPGGRICYAARTFDENNNQSPLFYFPFQVRIPAQDISKIIPSMQSAEPVGDAALPKVSLSWFGPSVGVAGFRIHFGAGELLTGNEGQVSLSPNEYRFDNRNNIYHAILDITDDARGEKVALNRTYVIRAEALMQNGERRMSNNTVIFDWAASPRVDTHPAWPIRGLPPAHPALEALWLTNPEPGEALPFTYGVGIPIGTFSLVDLKLEITPTIQFPFIVYRRRVDVPGTYRQISPTLLKVNINQNNFIQDPFFTYLVDQPNAKAARPAAVINRVTGKILFLDTVHLVRHATYEYKIVRADSMTGEIVEEIGPSNPVEVMEP